MFRVQGSRHGGQLGFGDLCRTDELGNWKVEIGGLNVKS